jgi:hypothetical protein
MARHAPVVPVKVVEVKKVRPYTEVEKDLEGARLGVVNARVALVAAEKVFHEIENESVEAQIHEDRLKQDELRKKDLEVEKKALETARANVSKVDVKKAE